MTPFTKGKKQLCFHFGVWVSRAALSTCLQSQFILGSLDPRCWGSVLWPRGAVVFPLMLSWFGVGSIGLLWPTWFGGPWSLSRGFSRTVLKQNSVLLPMCFQHGRGMHRWARGMECCGFLHFLQCWCSEWVLSWPRALSAASQHPRWRWQSWLSEVTSLDQLCQAGITPSSAHSLSLL